MVGVDVRVAPIIIIIAVKSHSIILRRRAVDGGWLGRWVV